MALIPKSPQPVEVKHFRGILLLPTPAKSFHSLIRKRIIRLLDRQRMPGQFSGFAGQEVLFGSQALRILGRTMSAKGLSMGVLFVDLSTAFHCLVSEMDATTSGTPTSALAPTTAHSPLWARSQNST